MVQQPRHQRKNRRQRRFSFGRLFDQRGAIAGVLEPSEFFPQSAVCLAQDDFAQRVQLRAAAARAAEVGKIEEVEFAAKRRFGASGAFGDSGDAAEIGREPVDDEAGFGQRAGAENQALGAFDHLETELNHEWTRMDTNEMTCFQPSQKRPGRPADKARNSCVFVFIRGFVSHRFAGENSGAMAPRLMMNLMPSATEMSSLVISFSGTSTRKPLVGLGVVGTNTLNTCSLVFCCTSLWSSPVTKPTEYWPARGNSTSTTCLKEDLLLGENA